MELENVKLTAKLFLKVSKNGKQYHQVEIYCKNTLISQAFLKDTEVSLVNLLSNNNIEIPKTEDSSTSLEDENPYLG